MNLDLIIGILQIVLVATTPLVFAGIGELVTEKSGVLNLGVEGMMLVGAVTAFVTLVITGSYILAFMISIFSGIMAVKIYNLLIKKKINPLIGATGLSAVPMASRVANELALNEDNSNHIMHYAMASNIAGVIGSAVAAGILITFLS